MSKLSFETPEFLKFVSGPTFKEEVSKVTSEEDLRKLFEKNGVKMTDEQFIEFAKSVYFSHNQGVVDDAFLEKVSGGASIRESIGDFIKDHPYLTFFAITGIVSSICAMPASIVYAARHKK